MTLKAYSPLEWRKANPISHADYKGFDGERQVARIYMAVSDVSMGENWHWELTAEHEPSRADQYAGQAPSHLAAADAAEKAYASTHSTGPCIAETTITETSIIETGKEQTNGGEGGTLRQIAARYPENLGFS